MDSSNEADITLESESDVTLESEADVTMESEENEVNTEENDIDDDDSTTEFGIPGFKSMEEFSQSGLQTLSEAMSTSNSLPLGQDWDLFNSYPAFQQVMNKQGQRMLKLITSVFRQQGIGGNIARRELDEKMDLIIDANDTILERVGINLDELDGIRKNPEPQLVEATGSTTKIVSGSWNRRPRPLVDISLPGSSMPHSVRLLTAKNIERPQAKFKDKIDNTNTPFVPRIKDKPNSLKPLAIFLEETELGDSYSHPYEYELARFTTPASQLVKVTPLTSKPLNQTPLEMISKPEQLVQLVKELEQCTEFAVDLEHHNYRSFQGITCLMQISTRDKDYIIDTLELRDSLHCLNEVFTKPSIVKVFHGADHDVEWLQRDLCLYVVNMFDTHQAARLLNFPHLSLAYLLKMYCKLDVNKHFQLADWRIRPLPEELVLYAREDTHYLLYVYDLMKNALVDAANGKDNLVASVFQRGTILGGKRYMKPICREDSHMDIYRRNKKLFDNRQLFALKEIYNWRDSVARQEDESTGYVLPNHMMLHISESLPREMQGILACCNPIPPLVRQNLVLLHQFVLKAREQPLIKIIEENRPAAQSWAPKVNNESPLHCPHDLTQTRDFRDDLPTLLGSKGSNKREGESIEVPSKKRKLDDDKKCRIDVDKTSTAKLLKSRPIITLFQNSTPAPSANLSNGEVEQRKQVTFVSPYQRLLLVQPFNQAQEEEEQEAAEGASEPDAAAPVKVEEANDSTVQEDGSDTRPKETNAERIQRIKDHFLKESIRLRDQEMELLNESLRSQAQKKRKRDESLPDNEEPIEIKQENSPVKHILKQPKLAEDPPTNKKKKKKNNKKKKLNETPNESVKQEFQPFDYSQVDFNRFKGGSNVSTPNTKDRSKFKSKNKKKHFMGVPNNKSCSFRGKR